MRSSVARTVIGIYLAIVARPMQTPHPTEADSGPMQAAAALYHAYFTGLILTLVTRRSAADAAQWVYSVFRHQHREKFLSSFDKLGLRGMPDAVACAAYHYLSNSVGGVTVEFMRESDRKAWVNFVPPRWIYPGASICGVPSEVSRAFLRGWYAENGVSLKNPRLGFVCTAQTTDGQHGLSGYFLEHDRELAPEERLQFRPGELPPPFDPAAAPKLPAADWPPERLAKAERNYAMEYIRSGLPRLAELFGPAEAAHLGRVTGRLVGAQLYREMAARLGIDGQGPRGFRHLHGAARGRRGRHGRCQRGWRCHAGAKADMASDAWSRAAFAGHLRSVERPAGGRTRRARSLLRIGGPRPPRLGRRDLRVAHPPTGVVFRLAPIPPSPACRERVRVRGRQHLPRRSKLLPLTLTLSP